jgi:hypothetical protein
MKLNDIKQVGVVGAGTMGFGIALNFALWGYPTFLNDLTDEILDKSRQNIDSALTLFVEEKLITTKRAQEAREHLTLTPDLARVAKESDFITEAITESVEAKRKLFNELDRLCPPHTILASNTSYLTLSEFADEVKRQDKVVITHYFVPTHRPRRGGNGRQGHVRGDHQPHLRPATKGAQSPGQGAQRVARMPAEPPPERGAAGSLPALGGGCGI